MSLLHVGARSRGVQRAIGTRGFRIAGVLLTAVIAFLILYPMGRMVYRLLFPDGTFSLESFVDAARAPGLTKVLHNTFVTLAIAGSAALFIGSIFAWFNERTDATLGRLGDLLPIVPLLVPPVAGTIGWVLLASPGPGLLNVGIRNGLGLVGIDAGSQGPINVATTWWGLIFVYTLYLVPYTYLIMSAAMRNLDSSLEEAARVSNASPFYTIRRVTLPAVKRAIGAAALMTLIIGFALYSVPIIIGPQANVDILSVRIVRLVTTRFPARTGEAIVLSLIVLAVIGTAWVIQARIAAKGRFATIGGRGGHVTRVRLSRWKWPARSAMVLYLACTSILPMFALLVVSLQGFWSGRIPLDSLSLRNYRELLFGTGYFRLALPNSVMLGLVGATLGVLVATIITYNARSVRRLGQPLNLLLKSPGAISNIVIGVAFVLSFTGPPFRLGQTLTILLLAYLVVYMPQASIAADSALSQVGRELEEAAVVSNASPLRVFTRVTLPLMLPGLIGGWTILFVLMAGDLTVSQMLASVHSPVVGFALIERWLSGTFPQLAALAVAISVVNIVVVSVVLTLSRRLARRGQVSRRATRAALLGDAGSEASPAS